eukprot:5336680-Pleurochrysis_carterae.AAC.5
MSAVARSRIERAVRRLTHTLLREVCMYPEQLRTEFFTSHRHVPNELAVPLSAGEKESESRHCRQCQRLQLGKRFLAFTLACRGQQQCRATY